MTASLINAAGLVVSSATVNAAASVLTATNTYANVAAGLYRLRFDGLVASKLVCIDEVVLALKDTAAPVGAFLLKPLRYDRMALESRVLDFGQGEATTAVEYAIAKKGGAFGGWVSVSAGLAKGAAATNLVSGLEIDTEYDIKVRFSCDGDESVMTQSFRTSSATAGSRIRGYSSAALIWTSA